MKKFLALILSISMLIMCVPGISLAVSAETVDFTTITSTDGWETTTIDGDTYYLIDSVDKFRAVFDATGGLVSSTENFALKNSLDLSESGYVPTGKNPSRSLKFDGQGNTIKVNVTQNTSYFGALGGRWAGGSIKNLKVDGTISNSYTSDAAYLGGIVGNLNGAVLVENCELLATATVSTNKGYTGGIVGVITKAATIKNCICSGTVSGGSASIGGILGTANTTALAVTVEGCVNNGTVAGSQPVGGIVGGAAGTTVLSIKNCSNHKGSTSNAFGGIYGNSMSGADATVTIEGCYNTANITKGGAIVGAVAYHNAKSGVTLPVNLKIQNCYNTGLISGYGSTNKSSIIGRGEFVHNSAGTDAKWTGTITVDGYYDIGTPSLPLLSKPENERCEIVYSATNTYVLNSTVAQAYGESIDNPLFLTTVPEGFDPDVWEVSTDENYPYIQLTDNPYEGEPVEAPEGPVELTPLEKLIASGEGTATDPLKIATAEDFLLAFDADNYVATSAAVTAAGKTAIYEQTADITLPSTYKPYSSGNFSVTYDGAGKTITLNLGDEDNYVDIKARTGSHAHFGIFGGRSYSTIKNVNVRGKWYITASSSVDVGGIIGRISSGSLTNSKSYVEFHRDTAKVKIGGAIGLINSSSNITVTNVEFHGSINAGETDHQYQYAGGIIGTVSGYADKKVDLTGCKNYGEIHALSPVGGIVGAVSGNTGASLNIDTCANYGDIYAAGCVGGIIGAATNNISCYTITNCLNAGNIESSTNETSSAGTIIGYGAYDTKTEDEGTLAITVKDCYNTGKLTFKGSNAYKQMYASAVALGSSRDSDSAGTTTFTGFVTIDNFYDTANPNYEVLVKDREIVADYPINLDAVTITLTDIYTIAPGRILYTTEGVTSEFLKAIPAGFDATKWEVSTDADYPYIQLKTNKYEGAAVVAAAPIYVSTGTYVFVSNDYTGLEGLTFEGEKSEYYAIVAGKFVLSDVVSAADVEYGALVSKYLEDDSYENLDEARATEKFVGKKNLDGSYGILIYGTNMVETDRYYVRPYIKNLATGDIYYGNTQSFVLNPAEEIE